MSDCLAILTIINRILNRVEDDSNDYGVIAKYIAQRMEIEKNIASLLKGIIPTQYETKNIILKLFLNNLQEEAELHNTLSNSIQNELLSKLDSFSTTSKEGRQSIENTLKNPKKQLSSALNDSNKAQTDLENQRNKLKGLTGYQLEKQEKRVFEYTQKYQKAHLQEREVAMTISSENLPQAHDTLTNFDADHQRNIKESALCLNSLKKTMFDDIDKIDKSFQIKMNHYETSFHSERYINRVFDPTQTLLNDNEIDQYALAIADYNSTNPSDLNFERGDQIKIIEENESGWYEGELNGKTGLFPITFCIMPDTQDLGRVAVDAVFLVNIDFMPTKRNELQLLMGDLVYVDYISLSDGKCSGRNLRNKKAGYFPLACLDTKLDDFNYSQKLKI